MPNISFSRPIPDDGICLKDEFILLHMPEANGTYVKVFLYAYYQFCKQTADASTREIAQQLSLLESDVLEALHYWQAKGLLSIETSDTGIRLSFQNGGALPPTSPERPRRSGEQSQAQHTPAASPAEPARPVTVSRIVHVEHKPTYAPEELAIYQANPQIQQLINQTQEALGETLSFPNMSLLYSFYDYYRLPVDVVSFLVSHCIENGGRSLRYMERVAQDWSDHNITSVEQARQYVNRFSIYRPIMNALRLKNARPSEQDQKYMDRWLNEYHMPMELITEACSRTIAHTGQSSFPYTDSILESWYSHKIYTLEAVAQADASFAGSQVSARAAGSPKGAVFNYIPQDDLDYDALIRLSTQSLCSDERK